jgi:hypothetical protein
MTDVTFHLDETLGHDKREALRDALLVHEGILAAASQDKTPHLMIIEYNPDKIDPMGIKKLIEENHVHTERLG